MKKPILLICLLVSACVMAQDDSDYNSTAKKIKNQLEKKLKKTNFDENEFCDLMLEMKLSGNYVLINKVNGTGSTSMCRVSKKLLKTKKKYRYYELQKYIHIHVEAKSL
jgi:hypothetical protein